MKYINKIVTDNEWLNALTNSADHSLNFIRCMYWSHDITHKTNALKLPHILLIFVEKGKLMLELNGNKEILQSGSMLLLSPNTTRTMWIPQGDVVSNYRLHFNIMETDKILRFADSYRILNNCHQLQPFFQRLNYLHRFPGKFGEFSIRATIIDLFATFLELYEHKNSQLKNRGLNAMQCRKIEDYLNRSIQNEIKPSSLTKLVELTPDYFTRLFRSTYGVSPRTYIKQQRILHASIMIEESSLRISEIANLCGCYNIPLFNRQFKDFFHCTPKQYRNKLIH